MNRVSIALFASACLSGLSGCWAGQPYEPLEACFESDAVPEEIDGGRKWVVTGTVSKTRENVLELDPPMEGCEPNYMYEIEDEFGDEHRLAFTLPVLGGPALNEGDPDVQFEYIERDRDEGVVSGFVIRKEGKVLMIGDTGVGGAVLTQDERAGASIERERELSSDSGSCGDLTWYRTDFAGTFVNPGDYQKGELELDGASATAYFISYDNHVWENSSCEDVGDIMAYAVLTL